jgi:hypothetical protein
MEKSFVLSEHPGQHASFVKFLHVGSASDEVSVNKHTGNAASSCHLCESVLNFIAVGAVFDLNRKKFKVDFLELLER